MTDKLKSELKIAVMFLRQYGQFSEETMAVLKKLIEQETNPKP